MDIDDKAYCNECGKPLSLYEYYTYRDLCERCHDKQQK